MKFQIDFNNETNDKILEEIGAKYEELWPDNPGAYFIEINDISELQFLLKKVNTLTNSYGNYYYSAIISDEPPIIYLDNKV